MKVVIVGGSGLIGKNLAALLRRAGHTVLAASPSLGVNAVTGEGLAQALAGAEVVVDVTNSPSFEDEAAMNFFQSSTRNLGLLRRACGPLTPGCTSSRICTASCPAVETIAKSAWP